MNMLEFDPIRAMSHKDVTTGEFCKVLQYLLNCTKKREAVVRLGDSQTEGKEELIN